MSKIERLRQTVIDVVKEAGKGHLGTSLSSLEAILAIREHMKADDIFISSKGHDAVAQYVVLAEAGILDKEKLHTFRKEGGLQGHPTIDVPGIKANTGSLGMGLSKALGFALGKKRTVYVLLGDGEMMEGQNWEAALAIAHADLDNIVALIDCNGFSQDGPAQLRMDQIQSMFDGAGWRTLLVPNGNSIPAIRDALDVVDRRPKALLLKTIKGNGVPEFEGKWFSHFGAPGVIYPPHPLYDALGKATEKILSENDEVILVGADTLRDLNCYELKNKFPKRVFDFGIAEQNAVSFASARALIGEIPIFATYACFIRRAFEQIYNQTTEGTKVIYVGAMAGELTPDGPGISHESIDDDRYMSGLMPVFEISKHRPSFVEAVLDTALSKGRSSYVRLMHNE